ncbi:MAG: PaaI family thioesterase [Acidimicrobiia bacterium]
MTVTIALDPATITDPAKMTGLEQLRAALGGELPPPGVGRLLGMELGELEEGRVAFTLETRPELGNPLGTVHGGIAATLLDSAMGCAVHSLLRAGERYTTLDLHVHYVRAIPLEPGRITATGSIVHRGGRTATAEGRIVDAAGRLMAHGTTTCMVFPPNGGAR